MRIPIVQGVIERRILVNYRIDPGVLRSLMPRPFRPKLVQGYAIGGICLIRLRGIRPRGLPALLGISSENCAHRFAVEWDTEGGVREGVFIPRRDTSSALNALVGGRLFPGVHHRATFEARDAGDSLSVALRSSDGETRVEVEAALAPEPMSGSVLGTLAEACAFFQAGSTGYSASAHAGRYDGLELRVPDRDWVAAPLALQRVRSSFFDDRARFPGASIELDSALLMREVAHEWHGREELRASTAPRDGSLAPRPRP